MYGKRLVKDEDIDTEDFDVCSLTNKVSLQKKKSLMVHLSIEDRRLLLQTLLFSNDADERGLSRYK